MCVACTEGQDAALEVPARAAETGHHAAGDVEAAEHRGQGRGEVLAVTAALIEKELDDRIPSSRDLDLQGVGDVGQGGLGAAQEGGEVAAGALDPVGLGVVMSDDQAALASVLDGPCRGVEQQRAGGDPPLPA